MWFTKLIMPPPFSLLVNSQDAGGISWPDGMLVTACVIRSGAEWQAFTNWVKGRVFKQRLKQGRTSRKTEKKSEAGYQKKNRITKREKEHWVGKWILKWVVLIPAESLFFDPNAVPPQCLLLAVRWLHQVLGTTLRMWPATARQGPLLSYHFYILLLGPQWLITST